ncbi:hypothetical protein MPER_08580, partial [Moniliophthora perniciosa FA553]
MTDHYETVDIDESEEQLALLGDGDATSSPRTLKTRFQPLFLCTTWIPRHNRVVWMASIVLLAVMIIAALSLFDFHPKHKHTFLPIESLFNGSWTAKHSHIQWFTKNSSQLYITLEGGKFLEVDPVTNQTLILADWQWFTDNENFPFLFTDWSILPSGTFLLVKTNVVKRWHRSKFGNYYIYDIANNVTLPLYQTSKTPSIIAAKWAPSVDRLAFVLENDIILCISSLLFSDPPVTRRITYTGSVTTFNGVGDWIYEEEILFDDHAFWWSPDSRQLAFLSLNDSEIAAYNIPEFRPPIDYDGTRWSPPDANLRYPFPGGANPTPRVYIFNFGTLDTLALTWPERISAEMSIIFEIAWTNQSILLVKGMSRNAQSGRVIMFDTQ